MNDWHSFAIKYKNPKNMNSLFMHNLKINSMKKALYLTLPDNAHSAEDAQQ